MTKKWLTLWNVSIIYFNHNMYSVGLRNTKVLIEYAQKSPRTLENSFKS